MAALHPSFFDVFDFEVLSGRVEALSRPQTTLLTPSTAEKYFGGEDAVGRSLTLNNERELEVVGIVAPSPRASHLQFDFLVSLATNSAVNDARPWSRLAHTYVKLERPGLRDKVEAKLSAFAGRHLAPHVSVEGASLLLTPLTDIHLFGRFAHEIQPQGDYRYVLLFSAVAFLVLLIACVNYVTLVTARSTERAREVGIRKSVGATRRELMMQFSGEAVVFTLIAVIVAGAIMWATIPSVETLLGQSLPFRLNPGFCLTLGGTLGGVMLVCGGYPAFVLSRFAPVSIFKGRLPTRQTPKLRRALVVFQFAVSIALIGGSLVIQRQLSYVQETRLGFDYLETLGLELVDGRDFSEDLPTDLGAVIVNETAVDAFGWNEPLGMSVRRSPVIGVVRDFHIRSLHEWVRPALLHVDPGANARALVRLSSGWTSDTIEAIGETWAAFVPSVPFDYSFLDQEFDAMYRSEQQLGRIFVLFTMLAVVLACLGLFGVSAFIVQQRTKEIGIRKVLGATASSVIALVSKEFVALVAVGALLGGPVVYFGMRRWLESFAYRAPVGMDVVAMSVGIALALALALVAVGGQAWRAAHVNPAESLRSE